MDRGYRKGDRVRLTGEGLDAMRRDIRSGPGATVLATPRRPVRVAIRLDGRRDLCYVPTGWIVPDAPAEG